MPKFVDLENLIMYGGTFLYVIPFLILKIFFCYVAL
jgi:hypothetical protein